MTKSEIVDLAYGYILGTKDYEGYVEFIFDDDALVHFANAILEQHERDIGNPNGFAKSD